MSCTNYQEKFYKYKKKYLGAKRNLVGGSFPEAALVSLPLYEGLATICKSDDSNGFSDNCYKYYFQDNGNYYRYREGRGNSRCSKGRSKQSCWEAVQAYVKARASFVKAQARPNYPKEEVIKELEIFLGNYHPSIHMVVGNRVGIKSEPGIIYFIRGIDGESYLLQGYDEPAKYVHYKNICHVSATRGVFKDQYGNILDPFFNIPEWYIYYVSKHPIFDLMIYHADPATNVHKEKQKNELIKIINKS